MRKIIYLILCHNNFGLERKAKKQSLSQELAQSSAERERAYDAEITGRQPPSGSTAKALQGN